MPKTQTKYNPNWQKEFSWLGAFPENIHRAQCSLCDCDFNIGSHGRTDVSKHAQTEKHTQNVKVQSTHRQISQLFLGNEIHLIFLSQTYCYIIFFHYSAQTDQSKLNMAAVEGTMVYHLIEENQSFRSMICMSNLLRTLCGQKEFACSHTKAHAIVSGVFEPMVACEIKKELEQTSFVCISTDASNHKAIKLYPVLVRYFLPTKGIRVRLIDLNDLPGETSEIIFEMLNNVSKQWGIDKKIVAFSGDNCPTNFGSPVTRTGENNVFYKLQQEHNNTLIGIGCLAHMLHNAINFACTHTLPHDMEAVIVKIYKQFYIYTSRTSDLKRFCEEKDLAFKKLKSYGKTRFIGMKNCLQAIIDIFDALKMYFEENQPPILLKNFFNDPLCRFLLLFLRDACEIFELTIIKIEGDKISGIQAVESVHKLKKLLERNLNSEFLSIATENELHDVVTKSRINKTKKVTKTNTIEGIITPFYGK